MKKIIFILFLIISFSIRNVYAEELISNAASGILIDAVSGKILYEKEKNMKLSVASLTKMVAQIIILDEIKNESIHWDDIVTVSKNASDMGGSQIYLEQGEKMSVKDLMKGISVASGNDAVVAMAEYISGSEDKFVKRMNEKVHKLGLKNTNFKNVTGLDVDDHYSTAYDIAMIARELVINYPEILQFSSIYEDYLRQDTDNKFWLVNTNRLIGKYEGCDGLKTGHTDNAGYTIAATAKRGNLRLIAVVLKEENSKIRNQETIELLDYGFLNTKVNILKKKNTVIDSINIEKANKNKIDLKLKDNLVVIEDINSKKSKYKYKIHINKIKYPVEKNMEIGYIDVVNNKNNVVARTGLLSNDKIVKKTLFDLYFDNLVNIITGNL